MPFDGFLMRRVVEEIKPRIVGQGLRNVFLDTHTLYFAFDNGELKVSLHPNHPHIAFVDKVHKDPERHTFVDLLRSRLRGGRVVDFYTQGFERTAVLEFHKIDELTTHHLYRMYFDIMGKHSNAVLVENGTIVDAFKRVDTRVRSLQPGEKFVEFSSGKWSVEDISDEDGFSKFFERLKKEHGTKTISSALVATLQGLSKLVAEEILLRAELEDVSPLELSTPEVENLRSAIVSLLSEFSSGQTYLYFSDGAPADVSTFRLHRYTDFQKCESVLSCINRYFEYVEKREKYLQRKRSLLATVKARLDDLYDVFKKINEDIRDCEEYDKYRKFGELLKAYAYQIPERVSEVTLLDWETGEDVTVRLDESLSAIENSMRYFKIYNKLKRKYFALKERIGGIEEEIGYLEQLTLTIEDADSLDDLADIADEMRQAGLIKEKAKGGKKGEGGLGKSQRSQPRQYVFNGFTILVGRNNRQNDDLVRSASDKDVWLHAQGMPGAHVLIKTGGKQVDEETLIYAARLAATFSRGRLSTKIPVDYTLAKNVRKAKGLKPGMVLYTDFKTLFVDPLEGYR